MASDMASYIESLAREVKEMDDRIEYLARKRLSIGPLPATFSFPTASGLQVT